jgi:DNA-3-methyladenine glycosylase I
MLLYHDEEWGVPSHDDRHLFELLTLEGAQAGLSWSTILAKREGYRRAFAGFDPAAVARFEPDDVERLLADPGIVRNRLKVESAVANATRVLELGSFASYLWDFVGGEPLVGRWRSVAELPAETDLSRALSRDLKRHGFRFVGPTVCYSFMQAVGLANDHTVDCFRFAELTRERVPARGRPRARRRPRARPRGGAGRAGSGLPPSGAGSPCSSGRLRGSSG